MDRALEPKSKDLGLIFSTGHVADVLECRTNFAFHNASSFPQWVAYLTHIFQAVLIVACCIIVAHLHREEVEFETHA